MSITEDNYKMGALHPDFQLPLVLPSFDKSVTYNQHVSLYLQLPKQLFPKHLEKKIVNYSSKDLQKRFWEDLNCRNLINAKQFAKLMCVLFSSRTKRQEILSIIETKDY